MPRIRRPSPALVVAGLALAIALSGTAVAATVALAPNSVGTPQLKNNAVTTAKVKNGSLLRADFRAGQVPAGPVGPAGGDQQVGGAPAGADHAAEEGLADLARTENCDCLGHGSVHLAGGDTCGHPRTGGVTVP